MDRLKLNHPRQLAILALSILLFRVFYVDILRQLEQGSGFLLSTHIKELLSNWALLLVMVGADIFCIIKLNRLLPHGKSPVLHVALTFAFLIAMGLLIPLLNFLPDLFRDSASSISVGHFTILFLAALLVNAVIVVLVELVLYYRLARLALASESNKKRKAIYQYDQLKQQLNPHFLFNSLNLLDYLVRYSTPDRASDYIKKLAGVYRYMLTQGESKLVPLGDEITFVNLYIDLLKERFADGMIVHMEIPKEHLADLIVPCGLQVLVENATKHNIVNAENPLLITIQIEDSYIVVQNNLQPRIRTYESTGVGLSNIAGQYADISNKNIIITQTETIFFVKLPLISKDTPKQ